MSSGVHGRAAQGTKSLLARRIGMDQVTRAGTAQDNRLLPQSGPGLAERVAV